MRVLRETIVEIVGHKTDEDTIPVLQLSSILFFGQSFVGTVAFSMLFQVWFSFHIFPHGI